MYQQTIAIDLSVSEEELLGSFHPTARRHIRALEKRPLAVRMITEPTFDTRLAELGQETQARSGGHYAHDWRELIRFATDRPALARLIGLFRTDRSDASALVAFALGLNHGSEIEYWLAGSTRPPDLRGPLGYALVWDLMRWGRRCGSQWFDFGGARVQADSAVARPDDGISEFKRYFSRCHVVVGEELVLVTAPVRSEVADYLRAGADWVRGLHR
jgi:lipid II:glycine glycyltransferase (peptidoglycan interpeptide bridge formation enzyme)